MYAWRSSHKVWYLPETLFDGRLSITGFLVLSTTEPHESTVNDKFTLRLVDLVLDFTRKPW
jgi:hypothetical protein